jgi:hypothetical protein
VSNYLSNTSARQTKFAMSRRNSLHGGTGTRWSSCDCLLSQSIVAELYSDEEMQSLRANEEYEEVAEYLARKMRST